mgnify:FL=1
MRMAIPVECVSRWIFLNRAVGWFRFFAEVLVHGIPGRTKARQLEDEYIEAYHQKHGRNPRGNAE